MYKITPREISQIINSRGGMTVMWVVALLLSYRAMADGNVTQFAGQGGIALPSPNNWVENTWVDWWLAIAANLGIALLAVAINRTYNVLRNMTMLFGGLYALVTVATPSVMSQFYGGTFVCLVFLACQFLLYSEYSLSRGTRTTFLIFFLLALGSLWSRALVFFMPIFIIGCLQMRIVNLRTAIAVVLGIISPLWILCGMGLIPLGQLGWPKLPYTPGELIDTGHLPMLVTFFITIVLGLLAMIGNLFHSLSYNSRTRAFNGFISITMIIVIVLMMADYHDILIYVPTLNILTAFQMAHFFIWQREKIAYIPVAVVALLYITLYIWNL